MKRPGRAADLKSDLMGLLQEVRERQSEIESHNEEIGTAIAEIIKQRQTEDSLQKSRHTLGKTTIEDSTAELRNAYELLNSIFASIDVHIAYLDPDFNFITVNQVYAAADKRTPDFYAGKSYFDLYPGEETEAIFRDVIETGDPYYEYEKPVVSMNQGRGVTYWNWSVQPVRGADNSVTGLVLTMINVTDRKRAEENTIRLAAAIESAGDAVVITDVRGIIKYVNPAFEKMTGYSKKEAIGRDKYIIDSGKQDEAFYEHVRETIRRRGSWTGRIVSKKKDGTLYTEECTCSVIRGQSGEIINYVSIGRDICEKLRLEALAHEADTSVSNEVRHAVGRHMKSIIRSLSSLKTSHARMDTSAIDHAIDGLLNDALKIEDLLQAKDGVVPEKQIQ